MVILMFLIAINHKEFAKLVKQRDLFHLKRTLEYQGRNTQSCYTALPFLLFRALGLAPLSQDVQLGIYYPVNPTVTRGMKDGSCLLYADLEESAGIKPDGVRIFHGSFKMLTILLATHFHISVIW